MLTLLVTDLVGSTSRAAEVGDRRWTELLDFHHHEVRAALARHGGTEVDTAGDGFLAVFALPSRALACAREARDRLAAGGLTIRAGLHAGEVIRSGTGVRGLGVHIAARVAASAGPGEIRASGTVADLVAGGGTTFAELGATELAGVPGRWRLVRVVEPPGGHA
ncbi:adenylate/guanylate cyclase domain-containing protein [Actinotalea ferrariae]|uniref:adenylate/guanylate cyclase domain-containing protein n=1 Tax=Actinotalea ferrariae TaxID=1386098 RepID=UPI00138DEB3F|nr:adenylate/guanylate cyclase domain-containing protein [Actinotalea ferrariae]